MRNVHEETLDELRDGTISENHSENHLESGYEEKSALLFNEYRSLMLFIANGVLNDYALAEDAVSESFIRIIRNLHKVDEIFCHKTRSLVVTIVKNVAIDMYNKRKGIEIGYGDDEVADMSNSAIGVDDEVISIDGYNNLVGIINALPPRLRDVADLVFIHKYDYNEASEILGITYDNVRQRVSRARKAITGQLQKHNIKG